jgi:hypothetical protein
MRFLVITLLFALNLMNPTIRAQEIRRGLELNFSLIHPAKWSLDDYKYSVDPTLEILYFTSLSKKFWVAGGIFAQSGKHNWLELYGHTFIDNFGYPYPFRTDYDRQLEFFSLGVPVIIGMYLNNPVFNSIFLGFTAGNHLKLEMADYLDSKFVADLPVTKDFNSIFWELNVGLKKIFFSKGNFELSLSSFAGLRKESQTKYYFAYYDYFFYGLGISSRFGR